MIVRGVEALLESVRRSLARVPGVDLRRHPIHLQLDHGALLMEGEIGDVAAKRRCLLAAAATTGVDGIADRLRVLPAVRMSDGDIRDHVSNAIAGEPALAGCAVRARHGGQWVTLRAPAAESAPSIDVSVERGVVTLDGEVPNLCLKRLAGALAWWVPGTRDVVNGLGVEPAQEDGDGEVADAVAVVLAKDPLIGAGRISVSVQGGIVTLDGAVRSADEKRIAEHDAWFVFGVNEVQNRLAVSP